MAIKRRLLRQYCERRSVPLSDTRVARLELSYHDITATGLRDRMEGGGLMRRLIAADQVSGAVTTPPATTRASLRGRIIGAAQDARRDLSVDWVHVRLGDISATPLTLNDPLSNEDARVDALIEHINQSAPDLPA